MDDRNKSAEVSRRGEGPHWGWRVAGILTVSMIPFAGSLLVWHLSRSEGEPQEAPRPPRAPAPRARRIGAAFIDLGVAFLLLLVPYVGWAFCWGYLLFRDSLGSGRGPGKRLLGIGVVLEGEGGQRPLTGVPLAAFLRNGTVALPVIQLLTIPLEGLLLLLGRRRIGERFAPGTRVVLWEGP